MIFQDPLVFNSVGLWGAHFPYPLKRIFVFCCVAAVAAVADGAAADTPLKITTLKNDLCRVEVFVKFSMST